MQGHVLHEPFSHISEVGQDLLTNALDFVDFKLVVCCSLRCTASEMVARDSIQVNPFQGDLPNTPSSHIPKTCYDLILVSLDSGMRVSVIADGQSLPMAGVTSVFKHLNLAIFTWHSGNSLHRTIHTAAGPCSGVPYLIAIWNGPLLVAAHRHANRRLSTM